MILASSDGWEEPLRPGLGPAMRVFGIAPYRGDQPLWTRVAFPFRMVALVLYLCLGPAMLWIAYDNVVTGKAVFAFKSASAHVTRSQFPKMFWTYTAVTAGLGLFLTAINLGLLFDRD